MQQRFHLLSTFFQHDCNAALHSTMKKKVRADPLIYYSAWVWHAIKIFFLFSPKVPDPSKCHMILSHGKKIWWNSFWEMCTTTPHSVLLIPFFRVLFFSTFFEKHLYGIGKTRASSEKWMWLHWWRQIPRLLSMVIPHFPLWTVRLFHLLF